MSRQGQINKALTSKGFTPFNHGKRPKLGSSNRGDATNRILGDPLNTGIKQQLWKTGNHPGMTTRNSTTP